MLESFGCGLYMSAAYTRVFTVVYQLGRRRLLIMVRWLETFARYDYKIEHRPGKKHQNADALSRISLPVAVPDQAVETNAVDSSDRVWLQSWTGAKLQSKQEADPNLRQVLLWKWNGTVQPAQREVQGTSKGHPKIVFHGL